jgi:hypothetical protein
MQLKKFRLCSLQKRRYLETVILFQVIHDADGGSAITPPSHKLWQMLHSKWGSSLKKSRELEIDPKMILCLVLAGDASMFTLSGRSIPDYRLRLYL